MIRVLAVAITVLCASNLQAQEESGNDPFSKVVVSEAATFRLEKIAEGFETPVSMAFIGDGKMLVADRREGTLTQVDMATGAKAQVNGLPDTLVVRGDTGLLDVVPHPDFAKNSLVYFGYSVGTAEANSIVAGRARLDGTNLVDVETVLEVLPLMSRATHHGGRIVLQDGYLFLTMGEHYDHPQTSQDLSTGAGTIMRVHDDGRIPEDNPFVGVDGARPEIWSYGHRNPQGMAINPKTGDVWSNEHGPQGGDEINIVRSGLNYGWPVITYGEEYGGGPIGDGITARDSMEQPLYYYRPSIAPSGMAFYQGDRFPGWNGSVFVGAMALQHLNRLVVHEDRILHEERLLTEHEWRVRDVRTGPDGYLYIAIDDGLILRLVPAEAPEPEAKERN